MKVFVNVKKAGSKRMALTKVEYELPSKEMSVQDIIDFFVECEVKKYNISNDSLVLKYLSEKAINDAASQGKVSFGARKTEHTIDLTKAKENALECYRDGLVCVFLNDEQLTALNETVTIAENDQLTFVRLAFLTGRRW